MANKMKPGSLMKSQGSAATTIMNRMFKATSKVKTAGSFHGKSNALGHGGRAAQLKARGVPGGVIGELARRAGAAPGGPNYHGKKGAIRKKSSMEGGVQTRSSGGLKYGPTTGGTRYVSSVKTPNVPTPSMTISDSTPKMKGSKRKKASKLDMDMAYKKKSAKPKKKACE